MATSYVLNRDFMSSARLDLQHYTWVNQNGYHVHPSIPPSIGTTAGSHIADVGTGTGLWAIEVANQRPNSNVVALDVDLSQAPPPEWLPANVTTAQIDMLAERMPEDKIGRFDIVHMRHFVVVTPDVQRLAFNAIQLLKPGGYLQWSEFDLSRVRISKTHEHFTSEKLGKIIFTPGSKPGHLQTRQTWVAQLREVLEDLGLETIIEERRRPAPYYRNVIMETSLMSYREMSLHTMDETKGGAFRTLLDEAQAEILNQGKGVTGTIDCLTIVAWKP